MPPCDGNHRLASTDERCQLIFDTHAHLDDEQLAGKTADIIADAKRHGVCEVLTVATTLASSYRSIELAETHSEIFAAVGIHPNSCQDASLAELDQVRQLTQHPKVIAIGETGLDDYWKFCSMDVQIDYFKRQIRLSHETGLPFIVHMRDCESQMLATLSESTQQGTLNGIMHSFTGTLQTARQCLEWDMHISFAGMVTYRKNDELRQIAAAIPDQRLLVETDSPYLSPHPERGKRPNTPALIRHTVACLAEARGATFEETAELTRRNALRLFRLETSKQPNQVGNG